MRDEKSKKNLGGRPSLYNSKYCEALIQHMSQGLSYESFAGTISVSKQTLYDWEKANPEFVDAKEVGLEKSRIFWESLGIQNIINTSESSPNVGSSSKSLNASVWIFNMKNRFGWRDKQPDEHEVVINNANTMNLDKIPQEEFEARYQAALNKSKESEK